jgi:hypothetical protein
LPSHITRRCLHKVGLSTGVVVRGRSGGFALRCGQHVDVIELTRFLFRGRPRPPWRCGCCVQWCAASALSLTTAHTLSTACMRAPWKERWVGLGLWSLCRCDRIDPFSAPWPTPARRGGVMLHSVYLASSMQPALSLKLPTAHTLSTDPLHA